MKLATSQAGFSLTEVVVCTMLVGVMIFGSMSTITVSRFTHRQAANQSAGPGLAQELLSEILAQAYQPPTTETSPPGGSPAVARESFDDVDDYDGYSSSPVARDGTPLPGYEGWLRTVEVQLLGDALNAQSSDQGLKRITVRVTDPEGTTTTLTALRWREDAFELTPSVDVEAVVWMGASLRTAADSRAARTGVQLPNLVPNPNAN